MDFYATNVLIDVGHGIAFPETLIVAHRSSNQLPLDLTLEVKLVPSSGRYLLKKVTMEVQEVDAEINGLLIRSIPFQEVIVSRLSELRFYDAAQRQFSDGPAVEYSPPNVDQIVKNGPTLENLREVAKLHRIATVLNVNQGKHVQSVLGIPYATAANWIMRARRHGLIEDRNDKNFKFVRMPLPKGMVATDFGQDVREEVESLHGEH